MRRWLASWFGSGLLLGRLRGSDAGSGTVGAAAALAMGLALGHWGWPAQAAAALIVAAVSVWAADPFARRDPGSAPGVPATKEGDPGWVVVDEAAGALLATIGLGLPAALVGFVVFRAADIFKRAFPGVGRAERLGGGWGITADDVVAGLYGLAAGWAVQGWVG